MAMTLVPYHGGMRVGQGFNSYTQEICLADAVKHDTQNLGGDHYGYIEADPLKLGQIVTSSSRFVDNVSDVTSAMGISNSASIRSGSVGGSANGNFVDVETFKNSDVNYFIQCKVTNQTVQETDALDFVLLAGEPEEHWRDARNFTEVYGDSFISGFVEGGELDIVVSVKVLQRSRLLEVREAIEKKLGPQRGEIEQSQRHDPFQDTETTIIVNWSGGGEILPAGKLWNIDVLPSVIAEFASKVAKAPQRVYAILSSYLTLRTFRALLPYTKPLDYSKAHMRSADLLNTFMGYKAALKLLQTLSEDAIYGGSMLIRSNPSPEIANLINGAGRAQTNQSNRLGQNPSFELALIPFEKRIFVSAPYEPTPTGLYQAKLDCEAILGQIVDIVNAIASDPSVVETVNLTSPFLPSEAFLQLLPIRRYHRFFHTDEFEAPIRDFGRKVEVIRDRPYEKRIPEYSLIEDGDFDNCHDPQRQEQRGNDYVTPYRPPLRSDGFEGPRQSSGRFEVPRRHLDDLEETPRISRDRLGMPRNGPDKVENFPRIRRDNQEAFPRISPDVVEEPQKRPDNLENFPRVRRDDLEEFPRVSRDKTEMPRKQPDNLEKFPRVNRDRVEDPRKRPDDLEEFPRVSPDKIEVPRPRSDNLESFPRVRFDDERRNNKNGVDVDGRYHYGRPHRGSGFVEEKTEETHRGRDDRSIRPDNDSHWHVERKHETLRPIPITNGMDGHSLGDGYQKECENGDTKDWRAGGEFTTGRRIEDVQQKELDKGEEYAVSIQPVGKRRPHERDSTARPLLGDTSREREGSSYYFGPQPLFKAAEISAKSTLPRKMGKFRMSYFAGEAHSRRSADFFNDLNHLESTWEPSEVRVWWTSQSVIGLKTRYRNGTELKHGKTNDYMANSASIKFAPRERVTGVKFIYGLTSPRRGTSSDFSFLESIKERTIVGLRIVTSHAETGDFGDFNAHQDALNPSYEEVPGHDWTLKGFYGECSEKIERLGLVWGVMEDENVYVNGNGY